MARSKLIAVARCLTLAASVGAPSLAAAADLLPPPPPPPPVPIEVGGGWYLRGDVGASIYTKPTLKTYDDCYDCYTDKHSYDNAIGGGGFAGVGVGYQFTPFFRGDVTAEYRYSTGLRGSNNYNLGTDDYGNGKYAYDQSKAHYDAGVFLANAYFDLGTWYGITPFIGGGAGFALNHIGGYQTNSAVNSPIYGYSPSYDDCGCGYHHPTFAYGPTYNPDGSTQYKTNTGAYSYKDKVNTSFAWALHAGLAYNVTDAFKVELAYRYLNLGKAETGGGFSSCCGGYLSPVKVKDIEAHDIKIGLRYALGGAIAAPLPPLMPEPMPGPIVRKY